MRTRLLIGGVAVLAAALAWPALSPKPARAQSAGFEIKAHHVGISVPNLDESIDWYGRMLGFEVVRRVTQEGMTFALLRQGEFHIELFELADGQPMPEYRRDPSADLRVHGTKHLAFQVADARAAAAELEAKGAVIAFGPVENERSIFVFVSDNSGNTFELIQPKQ